MAESALTCQVAQSVRAVSLPFGPISPPSSGPVPQPQADPRSQPSHPTLTPVPVLTFARWAAGYWRPCCLSGGVRPVCWVATL